MKLRMATLAFVLAILGCGLNLSPEEKAQMEVIHALGPHLRCLHGHATLFFIAPLEGGYAAIVKEDMGKGNRNEATPQYAYWVSDHEVYAVFGADIACSEALPMAPSKITYERVREITGH